MQTLDSILTERDIDDERAGESVGVSRSQMSKLRRGKSRPSLDVAVKIERQFGVPCASWIDLPDPVMPASSPADAANHTRITADISGGAE